MTRARRATGEPTATRESGPGPGRGHVRRCVPAFVAAGLAATLLLTVVSARAAEGDLEDGLRDYETGDYAAALSVLAPLADAGDATASYHLGLMYDAGLGVPLDRNRALALFTAAADAGNGDAAHALGTYYELGQVVPRDPAKAARWYRLSADAGNEKAMGNLGNLYEEGLGVPRDTAKAATWFERAADRGNAKAMRRLARLYERGEGVAKDPHRAHELMSRASVIGDLAAKHALALARLERGDPEAVAEGVALLEDAAMKGYVPAKLSLARIYLYGLGTDVDRSRAYFWLRSCANAGDAWARQRLAALESRISEKELLRSRRIYSDAVPASPSSDGEVLAQ